MNWRCSAASSARRSRLAEMLVGEALGQILVLRFGGREIAEETPDIRIGRSLGGFLVEALRLPFHCGGLFAHLFQSERADEPVRCPVIEARDMFAPDQRNGVAELALEELDQPAAMVILFLGHAVEHGGARGIFVAQPIGVVAIDAAVFFLR